MKRVLRISIMALVMVLCLSTIAPAAQAAQAPVTASVEATVNVSGSDPLPGSKATFEITAVTEGAPMPDSTTETIVLSKGANTVAFEITYTRVGVYEYIFQMTGGNYFLPAYDGAVYHVFVTISNSEDYQSFNVAVAAYKGDANEKGDIAYDLPLRDLTVNKKWIDQASSRPSSINVDLYCGSTVLDTVSLSAKNSWQYTWTGLDSRLGVYSVKENKVPAGYTASYKEDTTTGIWTITNTGSLLQTGQLNWPIPVLVIAGMLMLGAGYLMLRKKEEKNA